MTFSPEQSDLINLQVPPPEGILDGGGGIARPVFPDTNDRGGWNDGSGRRFR